MHQFAPRMTRTALRRPPAWQQAPAQILPTPTPPTPPSARVAQLAPPHAPESTRKADRVHRPIPVRRAARRCCASRSVCTSTKDPTRNRRPPQTGSPCSTLPLGRNLPRPPLPQPRSASRPKPSRAGQYPPRSPQHAAWHDADGGHPSVHIGISTPPHT